MRKLALVVLALAAICAAQATREQATGDLIISPTDTTRTQLPGATITLLGETLPNHEIAQTLSKFSGLPVGTYSIRVAKPGYRTAVVNRVEVIAGRTGGLVIILQPGQQQDIVEVDKVETVYADPGLMDRFYAQVPRKHHVDDIPGCLGRGMEPGVSDSHAGYTKMKDVDKLPVERSIGGILLLP